LEEKQLEDWAVIGLGNPGPKYELTRHNVGFWSVDLLAREVLSTGSASTTKFNCEYLRHREQLAVGGRDLFLIKPLKYMNRSGEAAQPLLNFFKLPPKRIVVLHDDVDLDSGALKAKFGGSSGGHHGIDDLERHLGTKDFFRVRIGIGRESLATTERDVSGWVLSAPRGEEMERLRQTALDGAKMALEIATSGLERASQKFSRRAFTR